MEADAWKISQKFKPMAPNKRYNKIENIIPIRNRLPGHAGVDFLTSQSQTLLFDTCYGMDVIETSDTREQTVRVIIFREYYIYI